MSKERQFTALAWNVKSGFSNQETAGHIADFVQELSPDIAIFSEATTPSGYGSISALRLQSYWKCLVPYDDRDLRLDTHDLGMIVSKDMFQPPVPFRAFGRTFLHTVTLDGELGFIGMHGSDRDQFSRNGHDSKRVEEVKAALLHTASLGTQKLLFGGDFNAMAPGTMRARILRGLAPITRLLPMKNPGEEQTKMERFGSLTNRLSYMALGGSITYLMNQGFVNADAQARGTIHLGPIHADLDHFFGRGVEMSDFTIHPHQDLTDHDAISLTVRY